MTPQSLLIALPAMMTAQTSHNHASEKWSRINELLAQMLIGWIPSKLGMLLRRLFYRPMLQSIGQAVNIDRGCEFLGAQRICIGEQTFIGRDAALLALPGNRLVLGQNVSLGDRARLDSDGRESKITLNDGVFLDRGVDLRAHDRGCIDIGQDTYIGPYGCVAGPGRIKIGRDCLIASHTGIYANNHNFNDLTRPINRQGTTNKGIVIEDDCWLGTGVKVLDGVTIGKGCVIGAGAVVTKDIPPFSVAVGVPARVISCRQSDNQHQERVGHTQTLLRRSP